LRKYVELSPSTPPFLTLRFYEKDLTPTPNLLQIFGQYSLHSGILIHPPLGHIFSTKDIVDGVTHELTLPDVKNDPQLDNKSTCIVTSNVDRAIINAEAAKALGKHNNVPIF
jgi:hypothetical protein